MGTNAGRSNIDFICILKDMKKIFMKISYYLEFENIYNFH